MKNADTDLKSEYIEVSGKHAEPLVELTHDGYEEDVSAVEQDEELDYPIVLGLDSSGCLILVEACGTIRMWRRDDPPRYPKLAEKFFVDAFNSWHRSLTIRQGSHKEEQVKVRQADEVVRNTSETTWIKEQIQKHLLGADEHQFYEHIFSSYCDAVNQELFMGPCRNKLQHTLIERQLPDDVEETVNEKLFKGGCGNKQQALVESQLRDDMAEMEGASACDVVASVGNEARKMIDRSSINSVN